MLKPPRAARYEMDPVTQARLHAREFRMEDDIHITLLGFVPNPPGTKGPAWAHASYQVSDLTTTGTFEWTGHHWAANAERHKYMADAVYVALGRSLP